MLERWKPYHFFLLLIVWCCLAPNFTNAQNLFLEECFIGGVTTGGANTIGAVEGSICEIKWEQDYILKKAYAITYRYGRPNSHSIFINDNPITWNLDNQFGIEQTEVSDFSRYFACHIQDISEAVVIDGSSVTVDLPLQNFNSSIPNEGYWGVHIVILYKAPQITKPVCVRIYTASQPQENIGQLYEFTKPIIEVDTPILFSIYSDRLSEFEFDRSRVVLNSQTVGDIWTDDLFSGASTGVQGTFYYENSEAFGLNGDTANNQLLRHDGIAVINDFLSNEQVQNLRLFRVTNTPTFGGNPHPAFLITYTPPNAPC